ncbi:isopropanol dehydrogenase [Botrytis cinerea]
MSSLPSHHNALVLESVGSDFLIKPLPTPLPTPGSAIVQICCTGILSYHREVYNGSRPYPFPLPIVGGLSAIARIMALGSDAVSLTEGQLVYVDCVVRGRDDPSTLFLSAIHDGFSQGSKRLMRDVWRNGTFADLARVPLENCIALNEPRLCEELGYSVQDLMYLCYLLVPYGGLRDIKLEAGETIVICPATGGFGGAGVQVAAAMGARVIAMGGMKRNWRGDVEKDAAALQEFGTIDAVLDISPPAAAKSTHLKSAINSLRKGGRASLMGSGEYAIDNWKVMGITSR